MLIFADLGRNKGSLKSGSRMSVAMSKKGRRRRVWARREKAPHVSHRVVVVEFQAQNAAAAGVR